MSDIELKARKLLASCLNEWGHHQEAGNVRDGEDLESYEFELRVIGQLLRFGFDTGYGHATRAPHWQPIESIPNGQLALFCDMGSTELRNSFFVDWMVDGKFCANRHHTATHWQPLPAPPEVEG